MKPLKDYAPFKIGERFEDEEGDVIEFILDKSFTYVNGTGYPFDIRLFGGKLVKPLDRNTQKPWRDMTDDEKAPILLAWADGKSIEWWDDEKGAWCENYTVPQMWATAAYRIAPEDVRKEQREFWIAERAGVMVEVHRHVSDAIHVREVTE